MRAATVVLAATLLAGTQAAAVPRSITETTTGVTETATETPIVEALTTMATLETTVEALTTTTATIETTTEAFTTTTAASEATTEAFTTTTSVEATTEATETTTATPTVEATETATATIEVPLTWADCEDSTVPHSTACVKKWFHAAGCMNRELPADKADAWANNDDIAAIESDMTELYANATAAGDLQDQVAFEACEPLPKPIMQVFDCVDNVMTDTCATCFTPKKFLGMTLPVMNGTCLGECIHNEPDKLADYCPNVSQMVSCHDTLKEKCGKCMKRDGKVLGLHIMDVNDDCFELCYWKNKDDIRAACPLPEPMKKAVGCHEALAEQCEECVGDDHEVDVQCLDGCFTEKSAQNETLKEMCPERLAAGMTTLAELMPTDEEFEYFFDQVLSNVELPFNLDLESIFDNIGKLMDNAYPGHGHYGNGNGNKPHHHDDDHDHDHDSDDLDDEEDDDDHMGQNIAQFVQGFLNGDMHNNTEVQTTIDGLLQQLFGNMGMNMATTTETAEPTETETETETETSTPDETETETSTPDETETETSTPDETETESMMTATTTATAEPTETMTDDVELAPENENPLLSFLESFISKILNFEREVAASATATAATSTVEATSTETVSATVEATSSETATVTETSTETATETETSTEALSTATETSTPTAEDSTSTEAATTTA